MRKRREDRECLGIPHMQKAGTTPHPWMNMAPAFILIEEEVLLKYSICKKCHLYTKNYMILSGCIILLMPSIDYMQK